MRKPTTITFTERYSPAPTTRFFDDYEFAEVPQRHANVLKSTSDIAIMPPVNRRFPWLTRTE